MLLIYLVGMASFDLQIFHLCSAWFMFTSQSKLFLNSPLFIDGNERMYRSNTCIGLQLQKESPAVGPTVLIAFHFLFVHLVILQTLLSKAIYNWGIHKAINLEEANRQRKCP